MQCKGAEVPALLPLYDRHTARSRSCLACFVPLQAPGKVRTLHGTMATRLPCLLSQCVCVPAGIKEITITLEEPFSVLALEAIANTAVANVRELQAMHGASPAGGVPLHCNNGAATSAACMVALAEGYAAPGGSPALQNGNGAHGSAPWALNGRSNGAMPAPAHH
jgi:hypothetical protein